MRFLANENFPLDAVEALRRQGHDVVWVRTDVPGSSDRAVLKRAKAEGRVLLTFDKDFAELAFHARLPASCPVESFFFGFPKARRRKSRRRCYAGWHYAGIGVDVLPWLNRAASVSGHFPEATAMARNKLVPHF
jgi:hypothetical protein